VGIFDRLIGKQNNKPVVEAEAVEISSPTLQAPSNSLKLGFTSENGEDYFGFYLPAEDRTTHCYVIGSSGVGKSKALANWILEDIKAGRGCGVIDPHGDLIKDIVSNLYYSYEKVILVDLTDKEYSTGFNPLEIQEGIDPFTQTLELVEVFRKIWELDEATTPRLLEILRNAIYTLIEARGTILDIPNPC
jgi:DNA helicase HerA-like ATPase